MAGDSPSNADEELEVLAGQRFGELSEAERRLLRAVPKGETARCGPNLSPTGLGYDPANADDWGSEREIRAGLISWLCVNTEAVKRIDPAGIQVYGAKIVGRLNLFFAAIGFPLLFQLCRFHDDIDLKFMTLPALNLSGSWTGSLIADGVHVRGDVSLDSGFTSFGEVRVLQARIGGNLDCREGTFKNLNGPSLSADRADVEGDVLLNEGFVAVGEVRLPAVQVGRQLVCSRGVFRALNLQGAIIKGDFVWREVQNGDGSWLDLTNASVGTVADDESSWPPKGKLILDGFVYQRITLGPTDARARLEWLDRQREFKPQPYRQLAKILREIGDDRGARRVLFEMEGRRRRAQNSTWYQRCWDQVLRTTIGYGLMSWWALSWLFGLIFVGFLLFGCGYLGGAIVPTEKEAYDAFEYHGQAPPYYPRFNALAYSFEHTFPLVTMGVKDHWAPKSRPAWVVPETECAPLKSARDLRLRGHYPFRFGAPQFLRYWLWFQTMVGWVLATLFVAGLTGIVRTGQ